jgi:Phosphoribosylpyrophosphate synthetase
MSYEDGKKLKIFSGNANPKLAKEIADYLGLELGKAFVGKFNNGEVQVMIDESVRGKDVFLIQPTSQPANDNLMELLIIIQFLLLPSNVPPQPIAENPLIYKYNLPPVLQPDCQE